MRCTSARTGGGEIRPHLSDQARPSPVDSNGMAARFIGNAVGGSLASAGSSLPSTPNPNTDPAEFAQMDFVEPGGGPGAGAGTAGVDGHTYRESLELGLITSDAGPLSGAVHGDGEGVQTALNTVSQSPVTASAEQAARAAIGKAAEAGGEQAAKGVAQGSKLAPFLEGVAPWLGKISAGVGLFFHMDDAPTTDWTAGGSKFSYNQDDFTLQVNGGDTGESLAVPGIHNPSQYTDAQYLSYVSYKANGGQLGINDFVSFDAPEMGPVDRASSQKPDWLQRLDAGNAFNKERAGAYPYNEVYINKPSGDGYFRVDSYNPRTEEIVSRKFTQFSEITEQTGIGYVNEMAAKYPDGATIANVPTNIRNGLAGTVLTGDHILEIPVQLQPIPQAVLDAANRASVLIRDINGKTY